jgi:hypothetical protein
MHIIIQNTLDCVMKWPSWKKTLMWKSVWCLN